MFSSLIALIVLLLIITFSGEVTPHELPFSIPTSIGIGLAGYGLILLLIRLQGRRQGLLLAQGELLALLLVCHFLLFPPPTTPLERIGAGVISLFFYFAGLFFFHLTRSNGETAQRRVRFLLPFCLPFLVFQGVIGVVEESFSKQWQLPFDFLLSLFFLSLLLLFFPVIVRRIWGCQPIPQSATSERIEELCKRLKFSCGGMMNWPVVHNSMTAGIIGTVPRWRYLFFTDALLAKLPPEEIEAVVAHEIGHSQRRHLFFYPLLIFGLVFCLTLYSIYVSHIPSRLVILPNPSPIWQGIAPLLLFVPYVVIILLYLRLLLGLFSRLFERQADLHVLVAGIGPEPLIRALDRIAVATGNCHDQPSWHHYSIRQRIDFLKKVQAEPRQAERHHRRVKWSLLVYAFALVAIAMLLFAPKSREYPKPSIQSEAHP